MTGSLASLHPLVWISGTDGDLAARHSRQSQRPWARCPRPPHRRLSLQRKPGALLGREIFTPAVEKVAQRPEFFPILGATPYSLRRGGISLRLRAEDPQTVASECGTSLKMLSDHYAFAIEDLRRHGPRPVDVEWRAARTAQANHRSREQGLLAAAEHDGIRRQRKLFAWFAEHRQASRAS
jgi:hypothetical protein